MPFRRRRAPRRAETRQQDLGQSVNDLLGYGVPFGFGAAVAGSALAAAETASGMLERTLRGAEIKAGRWQGIVSHRLLATVARALILKGEQAIWYTGGTDPMLAVCWHQFVPRQWPDPNPMLWIDVPAPGGSRHLTVRMDDVAIPHWSTDPERPWKGQSPLDNVVSQMGGRVAGMLNKEVNAAFGYMMVLAFPYDVGDDVMVDQLDAMRSRTGEQVPEEDAQWPQRPWVNPNDYGRLFWHAASGGSSLGQGETKQGVQSRFGFHPPSEVLEACRWASEQTLTACGLPPNLMESNLEPGRDAWRRYVQTTAQPVADGIAEELSRVLEEEIIISLAPARTSDELASRARAAGSLASAGVPLDQALQLAGFDCGCDHQPSANGTAPSPSGINGAVPPSLDMAEMVGMGVTG